MSFMELLGRVLGVIVIAALLFLFIGIIVHLGAGLYGY